MSACVKCGESVPLELKMTFRECSHAMHADCLATDAKKSYKQCGACLGLYEQVVPISSSPAKVIKPKTRLLDGRDWCINPGTRNEGSTVKAVAAWIPKIGQQFVETVENSRNPFFLLKAGKEIADIMAENELDLPHFCKVGVTMRDFLQNGYTWKDLQAFDDIANRGAARALKVITKGLKTSANDFRDYPQELPFAEVKAHTQFVSGDVCRLFGLTFPERGSKSGDPIEGGYLQCRGDREWKARDCINLGLTMGDLNDFGLTFVHQYLELMSGLSQKEADDADARLETTDDHLRQLIDLEEEAAEEERQRMEIARRQEEARRQARMVPKKEEEEVEEEVEEVEEEPPIYYHHQAPFNPGPIQEEEEEEKEKIPLYEQRMRQRDRLHGLRKKKR